MGCKDLCLKFSTMLSPPFVEISRRSLFIDTISFCTDILCIYIHSVHPLLFLSAQGVCLCISVLLLSHF